MSVGDSELGMAAAQIFNGRNKRLEMIEPPYDHCEGLKELPALLR